MMGAPIPMVPGQPPYMVPYGPPPNGYMVGGPPIRPQMYPPNPNQVPSPNMPPAKVPSTNSNAEQQVSPTHLSSQSQSQSQPHPVQSPSPTSTNASASASANTNALSPQIPSATSPAVSTGPHPPPVPQMYPHPMMGYGPMPPHMGGPHEYYQPMMMMPPPPGWPMDPNMQMGNYYFVFRYSMEFKIKMNRYATPSSSSPTSSWPTTART